MRIVAAMMLCATVSVISLFPAYEANDDHVWLNVDGKCIRRSPKCTDPNGIWNGVGLANTDCIFNQKAVDWCAEQGINWFRLSFWDQAPCGSPVRARSWTIEEAIDSTIAPYVQAFKEKRTYSLLNLHYSLTGSMSYDSTQTPPVSDSVVQAWIDNWVRIASIYKDEPWVLGYELFNEPGNDKYLSTATLRDWYKRCVAAIGRVEQAASTRFATTATIPTRGGECGRAVNSDTRTVRSLNS